MSSIKYFAGAVADVVIPRHCAVCGRKLLVNEKFLCIFCLDDMPLTYNWNLVRNPMADRYNDIVRRTVAGYGPYAFAAGLFFFRGETGWRNICHELKYGGNLRIGRHFARMLGAKLASAAMFGNVDTVIPVPLHRFRKWRRGYNQAEVIAAEVAGALGADMRSDILMRKRRTASQTELDMQGKIENVAGAFTCRKIPQNAKHILLIDDVFTSGATLGACHAALREVLPPEVRISAATLAVTPESGPDPSGLY